MEDSSFFKSAIKDNCEGPLWVWNPMAKVTCELRAKIKNWFKLIALKSKRENVWECWDAYKVGGKGKSALRRKPEKGNERSSAMSFFWLYRLECVYEHKLDLCCFMVHPMRDTQIASFLGHSEEEISLESRPKVTKATVLHRAWRFRVKNKNYQSSCVHIVYSSWPLSQTSVPLWIASFLVTPWTIFIKTNPGLPPI